MEPSPYQEHDPVPTAVREVKARLAASAPHRGPPRLAKGAGLLVAGVVGAIFLAAEIGGAEKPQRAIVEDVPSREPAPSVSRGAESGGPTAILAPLVAVRDHPPSDEEAIDAALGREFGPPRVLPDGRLEMRPASERPVARREPQVRSAASEPKRQQEDAPATPPDPPWLHRSTQLASRTSAAPSAAPKARGIPLGTHMKAKLLTNLDSRTIGNGPVEAVLVLPVLVRGEVVLPPRTLVYGTATESSGRFNLRFTRLRLPDDTEVEFEGLALARDDGKPGLAAGRQTEAEPERQPSLGSKITKGTGNILLDTIAGGVGHDLARNAGIVALSHERPAERGSTWALLLDSGVVFDVWVERTF